MTRDQLIRQVIQGGGNMPAFGSNLTPPQVTALVKFLETLHAPSRPIATDASRGVAHTGGKHPDSNVEQGSQY